MTLIKLLMFGAFWLVSKKNGNVNVYGRWIILEIKEGIYYLKVSRYLIPVASGGWVRQGVTDWPRLWHHNWDVTPHRMFSDRTTCSELPFEHVWIPSRIRTAMSHERSACRSFAPLLTAWNCSQPKTHLINWERFWLNGVGMDSFLRVWCVCVCVLVRRWFGYP